MSPNFSDLQNVLIQYLTEKYYACCKDNCDGIVTSSRTIQNHLFIETDMIVNESQFSLNDFPLGICINLEK